MRILVAGGQGQVGSALATLGAEQGLDLVALGRSELDITDAASIAAAFDKYKPGLLINAAAYTAVDKAESEPELAYAINETATALLADACAAANIPMLHISTDYVFDGSKEGLYTEADPVNPLAVYAKSKEAGERALRERVEWHIILRTSWVFGVQGNNFVKTMVRLAKDRDRLTVVADQFGGPSSARGIATVLLTIAAQYESKGEVEWGTYHYCQKPYVSWHKFAQAIIESATEMGLVDHPVEVAPITSSEFPTPVTRPANSRLNTTKIEAEFGTVVSTWSDNIDDVIKATSSC
ncbi:dTDP-4-dehydrorhamnose reductase [Marinobacterium sp. xm-a-121]|uniref:dTDP-4-dehydrorhamnose reductase n=1 Tax=unclassified Marinobacterium TaxID=2644139 RepID=UPI0015683245|nr:MULTISPECIES: dTDP-4-dehydrorhamnose reductase [unclassified Marinobacterium]NRP37553.1 dTDP-4-dehydrorhamnose reductase [Marinobacterium sp. xm-a-121]NRP99897.1 dTDP-4-dehydrorhamnose reductase [Marinobacterium sp. xm-v-233]